MSYDKLVVATGAEASTFGVHGVKEHAMFLREVNHAQEIRRKLLLNLMLSDIPGIMELFCLLLMSDFFPITHSDVSVTTKSTYYCSH